MGSISSLLPIIGTIAGGAFGGPGGAAIGGAVGTGVEDATGGNTAQNNANAGLGAAQGAATTEANAVNQYYPSTISALAQGAGYNPTTGQYTPNYDPYFGQGAGIVNQYADNAAVQGNNAIQQTMSDMAGRGFGGGPNSGLTSEVGNIERQNSQDVAGFTRQLGTEGTQLGYQRLQQVLQMMNPNTQGLVDTSGAYQGQANAAGSSLSGLMGTGIFNSIFGTGSNPTGDLFDNPATASNGGLGVLATS